MDLRFIHPFTKVVAGPTSCGKSVYVEKLITNGLKCTNVDFDEILWCYSEWHPQIPGLGSKIKYVIGLDNIERENHIKSRLLVIDDLMRESDSTVVDLFTKGSHHKNTSVVFITQNVFHQGKGQRDISLNAHYMTLFKNPRDAAQIAHLARQIYPSDPKFIQDAYKDATSRPHGYLLFDLKQATPDKCRIRTNVFGEHSPGFPVVYVPKNKSKK